MPTFIDTLSSPPDARDLADEVSRLFDELQTHVSRLAPGGECRPPIDVVETDREFEMMLDVPGLSANELRVVLTQGTVLIVGQKLPPDPGERANASFHLVERSFGRFARAVRLTGAIDGARARASLRDGELRIVVPKMQERRGQQFLIEIESV